MKPKQPDQPANTGAALAQDALAVYERGDAPLAEDLYRRRLATNDRDGIAHNNLANLLRQSSRYSEAKLHYERALESMPDSAEIRQNLAGLLETLHEYDRAEAEYRRALELRPDFVEARFNLGLLLLAAGRYAEGWPLYESRLQIDHEHGTLPFPRWNGEDLNGKTLLLVPEQGYGDTIQFSRYASLLKARGVRTLSMLCKPQLAPLLRTVKGIDALVTDPQALHVHDYWDSVMSLPYHFGTTLESIPAEIPYLGVFTNRLDAWRERLPSDGVRVGLVWKGNPAHDNDAERSLRHFSDLSPLWSIDGVRFVSLQVGNAEAETQDCDAQQPILCLGKEIRDFADTAAIVAQLNLVICVDTAVAHVAGALGIACWLMLPRAGTDWRWHRSGNQSPWYPKDMYLFRQTPAGWSAVVEEVTAALADVMRGR
ncbi:tetratricopeptide repeat protein [Paraburkholderia sp.]|uniref:tetratricopeptide repeat protein n=1 Tax=Paraburkholderia sp. TaxID=1926495 RepID=UPI003D6E08E4